jgi:WD40 repeat protein
MVVAVLVSQFAPSSRGLERKGPGDASRSQWASSTGNLDDDVAEASAPRPQQARAAHRVKSFKAMTCLTSLASDFDVVSDWLFYHESVKSDIEYRAERQEGDGSKPYLIPPVLLWFTFIICILGTFMWLILATEGRIIAPVLRWLGYDKMSIGHLLLISVLIEDIPQVILTFLVEDYYEESYLSNLAVVNVTSSLYDTLIKLAEGYDERYDIVETGIWCKESLWAHHDVVTSVVSLPLPPSVMGGSIDPLTSHSSNRDTQDGSSRPRALPDRSERSIRLNSLPAPPPRRHLSTRKSTSVFNEALLPIAPMQLSRLRFLTTSLDRTVRLWDTAASMKGHRRDKCIRVFRGHSEGVTCIALLGTEDSHERSLNANLDFRDEEADHTTFFLTGCGYGDVKLWNLNGDCIRTYVSQGSKNGVTSIACIRGASSFVASYQDGSVRLWEVWSGKCICVYQGHSDVVNCICSMNDDKMFVTGSRDTALKLWDTTAAFDMFHRPTMFSRDSNEIESTGRDTFSSEQAIQKEIVCAQSFVGRAEPSEILCVACIEAATAFVAGSTDGIVRLWAVDSGMCLRVFQGHSGPVMSVQVVDQVTILSGSSDKLVKLWDAVSGGCLRTYADHNDFVASISVANDDQTFLTASADRTVKIWVITTVSSQKPEESLDYILDTSEGMCAGIQPA